MKGQPLDEDSLLRLINEKGETNPSVETSWTSKYWDMIGQLYWAPQYIGMKSISQRHWQIKDEYVLIPREMVNRDGPLYCRDKKIDLFYEYMRRQEESFNHIFDFAFATLTGDVTAEIFSGVCAVPADESYLSLGQEMRKRFGWTQHENVTAPDGLFTGEKSILAVELKFNAKTSLDQLAKYLMIMLSEEEYLAQEKDLHLLYIFNAPPERTLLPQLGIESLEDLSVDILIGQVKNKRTRSYLEERHEKAQRALERLSIQAVHWQDFTMRLELFCAALSDSRGERTIRNIIEGLIKEIKAHPLSNTD